MTDASSAAPAPASPVQVPVAPRPRHRLWRWVVRVAGVFALLMTVVAIAVPYLVSAESVRSGIAEQLSRQWHTRVEVGSHDFSWFHGLRIEAISIANPTGFPSEHKAFKLGKLTGDASVISLLWGELEISGVVEGMELRLYERADGSTNFGAIMAAIAGVDALDPVGGSRDAGGPGPGELPAEIDLAAIKLDLRVVDSRIEIEHEERGVLESLRHVETGIRKPFGSSSLRLYFNADLFKVEGKAGRLDFVADLEADLAKASTMSFKADGLDLSRYRSLVNSFVEPGDYPEAFAGVLGGSMNAEYRHGDQLQLSGDLELIEPHFKGQLFGGLDIRHAKWTFKPCLQATIDTDFAVQAVSTEGFAVQMGFLELAGMSAVAASEFAGGPVALGLTFNLDLRQLAVMGLTALDGLEDGKGRVSGTTTVVAAIGKDFDPAQLLARWSELIRSEVLVEIDGFQQEGVDLRGFVGDTVVEAGQLEFKSRPGAQLNGGALVVTAASDVKNLSAAKVAVTMQWQDGSVDGDAVRWLRYVVPLLDGLPVEQASGLHLRSKVNCDLQLGGPLLPGEGESALQWLNHWSGEGDMVLLDGSFTPAAVWKTVLEFAKLKAPIEFESIGTRFDFADGGVATELMKFNRGASSWGLSGKVDMAGNIDYGLDLRDLLRGHKDGEKVLKYLQSKPVLAKISGTLDAPRLTAPSYSTLLTQALGGAAEGALNKLLDRRGKKLPKGLKDLFKRR